MDLKGLKLLVNKEYKKFINEASFLQRADITDIPPEVRPRHFKTENRKLNDAINDTVDYAIQNFNNWDRTEVEQELAKYFEENHLDIVGWEDAGQVLDDEKLISEFEKFYEEDAEGMPLSLDKYYEALTQAMQEDDYRRF